MARGMKKRAAGRRSNAALWLAVAPRILLVVVMVASQLTLCWLFLRFLSRDAVPLYAGLELLSGLAVVALLNNHQNPSYRYAWVLIVLLLGVFGLALYLLWGRGSRYNAFGRRLQRAAARRADEALPSAAALQALAAAQPQGLRVARYLAGQGFPLYTGSQLHYWGEGAPAFEAMLADMEGAQAFIYMEFFIVFEGALFERFLDVMARKAAQGVTVCLLYDDIGSLLTTNRAFLERLRAAGIQVRVFNPVQRYTSQLYLNYRDHRKILAVDGHVAYTGGINIADEYANLYAKLGGHWKDSALRVAGPAAHSLTLFFTQMWQAMAGDDAEAPLPVPPPASGMDGPGFAQPYEDGPHNNPNNPAENVYRQMIAAAQHTLYITTPYLVVDDIMLDALCVAAQCGVDVRILLPSVPDHWYVHLTSQSFYGELLRAGVRVYEYTPGFIHSKLMVCDGAMAAVGSVNMDYRSFHLHYECAVWVAGGDMPGAVQEDIEAALAVSGEISLAAWQRRPWYKKMAQPVLRLFAPLM